MPGFPASPCPRLRQGARALTAAYKAGTWTSGGLLCAFFSSPLRWGSGQPSSQGGCWTDCRDTGDKRGPGRVPPRLRRSVNVIFMLRVIRHKPGQRGRLDGMGWDGMGRGLCAEAGGPAGVHPATPARPRLSGAPGVIGTRPAGTKAAEGGSVHAILPGLKGPDTLRAGSCGPEQVLGTAAPGTCSSPQPPPPRRTIKAHNGRRGGWCWCISTGFVCLGRAFT